MSNVRHLIENIIMGMKRGENPWEIVEFGFNADMLKETGITAKELIEIADEVVFGLYDGKYPTAWDDPDVPRKWVMGKCPNCGGHAPYWAMASTYYESNFCPHCGADMRE